MRMMMIEWWDHNVGRAAEYDTCWPSYFSDCNSVPWHETHTWLWRRVENVPDGCQDSSSALTSDPLSSCAGVRRVTVPVSKRLHEAVTCHHGLVSPVHCLPTIPSVHSADGIHTDLWDSGVHIDQDVLLIWTNFDVHDQTKVFNN